MELWDVYDMNRIKTGQTVMRGGELEAGIYHVVVHICIFNPNGDLLIQQRQPWKNGWPDLWDLTVGGCAVAGDTSNGAAQREVLEEIGYDLDLDHVRPALTINFESGFDDIYIVEEDLDINTLRLQHEEVKAVKWATKEDILWMIDHKTFVPYYKNLIALLFDMRKRIGVHGGDDDER